MRHHTADSGTSRPGSACRVPARLHNKTTESYIKLINREVDIILSYAPPQELMEAIEEAGGGKPAKYIKKSSEVHEEERVSIARRGYERFWENYEWEKNLKEFLDWAINLQK